MLKIEPTKRFSSRVENYVRFRPSYPKEVIPLLEKECGLTRDAVVADIASGTGIFTRLLLEHGNRVFAVEPNPDMRRAGEEYLSEFSRLVSVAGTAEATTLVDQSLDVITCAQAAHWFDRDAAMAEFQRILKPDGYLVLVWNDRRLENSAFGITYEALVVKYGTDYSEVHRRDQTFHGEEFFAPFHCQKRVLDNYQNFDFPALEGRLLSSSYAPQRGDPACAPMVAELRQIFAAHQQDGFVRMEYDTKIFYGKLNSR